MGSTADRPTHPIATFCLAAGIGAALWRWRGERIRASIDTQLLSQIGMTAGYHLARRLRG